MVIKKVRLFIFENDQTLKIWAINFFFFSIFVHIDPNHCLYELTEMKRWQSSIFLAKMRRFKSMTSEGPLKHCLFLPRVMREERPSYIFRPKPVRYLGPSIFSGPEKSETNRQRPRGLESMSFSNRTGPENAVAGGLSMAIDRWEGERGREREISQGRKKRRGERESVGQRERWALYFLSCHPPFPLNLRFIQREKPPLFTLAPSYILLLGLGSIEPEAAAAWRNFLASTTLEPNLGQVRSSDPDPIR